MSFTHPGNWEPQGVTDIESYAWQALRQTERSVLITAGAGAGKTEFLAQKATYLLQTGLCPAPKRILAISFKRDAAHSLTERVAIRCPLDQARRFNSYTFDAFSKNLVDRFRAAIPVPYCPPFDYHIVIPRNDSSSKKIARTRLPGTDEDVNLPPEIDECWRSQYEDYNEVQLTFPMLNRLAELLIRENPLILKAMHLTYPVVFLDEFQDTTHAQFQLLCTAFNDSKTIFTAVGDDKQRIMTFADAMPDAFEQFEQHFNAQKISLISNWRSHKDLVRIQHAIASNIDPNVEEPEAHADRVVDGNIAAIWKSNNEDEESEYLARWIKHEVQADNVDPHNIAILVRMRADKVEGYLAPAFAEHGLKLRNIACNIGDISIHDLLSEKLTQIFLRLMRLGATDRSPENWNAALLDLQFLEAVDSTDEARQQFLHKRLQRFTRTMRRRLKCLEPVPDSEIEAMQAVCDFIGIEVLRRASSSYRRQADFDRVWKGFSQLLHECLQHANTWSEALDEFEGFGYIPLMTIHKSKGLEFHTIIFHGLDNQTWWSLTPDKEEELECFFVAFTRAAQRVFFTRCIERGQSVEWIEDILTSKGVRLVDIGKLVSEQ